MSQKDRIINKIRNVDVDWGLIAVILVIIGIAGGIILAGYSIYIWLAAQNAIVELPDRMNNLDIKFERLIDVLNSTK